MRKKNIFEVTDVSQKEFKRLVKRTLYFSKNHKKHFSTLNRKRIGLLFGENSLRTKLSFEIATHKLGGFPYYV